MAAVQKASKGTQSKSAEQHNQERRAAKARQKAVRAAAAQRQKIKEENYKAGFKFVRNDGLERVQAEREEARLNKLNRQHDKAADKIFGE
jgi:tRNA pseudouridine-54 N-methylase